MEFHTIPDYAVYTEWIRHIKTNENDQGNRCSHSAWFSNDGISADEELQTLAKQKLPITFERPSQIYLEWYITASSKFTELTSGVVIMLLRTELFRFLGPSLALAKRVPPMPVPRLFPDFASSTTTTAPQGV